MADENRQLKRTSVSRPSWSGKLIVGFLLVAVTLAGIYAVVRIQRSINEPSPELSPRTPATASAIETPVDFSEYKLTEADISRYQASGLGDPVKGILYDLSNHNDLIPDQGSLGGTMLFWPTESKFVGPNEVLAYYEDGHSAGQLLLSFKVEQGEIYWQVEDTLPPPRP